MTLKPLARHRRVQTPPFVNVGLVAGPRSPDEAVSEFLSFMASSHPDADMRRVATLLITEVSRKDRHPKLSVFKKMKTTLHESRDLDEFSLKVSEGGASLARKSVPREIDQIKRLFSDFLGM